MILSEYYNALTQMITDNPECLGYDIVYSKDDEGNGFSGVNYTPATGYYDPANWEFSASSLMSDPEEGENLIKVVCIN